MTLTIGTRIIRRCGRPGTIIEYLAAVPRTGSREHYLVILDGWYAPVAVYPHHLTPMPDSCQTKALTIAHFRAHPNE